MSRKRAIELRVADTLSWQTINGPKYIERCTDLKRTISHNVRLHHNQRGSPVPTHTSLSRFLAVYGHRLHSDRSECHPQLYQNRDGTFALSWDFQSLLGAMYLQISFLMTATTAARFCKARDCNRVVALDAPEETPEGKLERLSKGFSKPYKPRSDKEFCGRACYMRWRRRKEKEDAFE